MSNLINVLETLSSNATLNTSNAKINFIQNSTLTKLEKKALICGDVETLKQLTGDLPEITCFGLVPAEDDEPLKEDDDKKENKAQNVFQQCVSA